MTGQDYKKILEQAKKDLLGAQEEMGECLEQQEQIEKKITALRQTVTALSRMLDEDFVEEDAMGLTDAIRLVFQNKEQSGTLIPTEVRDALAVHGFNLKKYGNVMASVHSVITRLADRGEIILAGTRADGKAAYRWKWPPPPRGITQAPISVKKGLGE